MIKLSLIFKWYREDFEKDWLNYRSLEDFLAAHAQSVKRDDSEIEKR